METILRWNDPPSQCDYVPEHMCRREYVQVAALDHNEYMEYLLAGWRRFGHTLFRNSCVGQNACRSLRVQVDRFHHDRSQRRTRKMNDGAVDLSVGKPAVTPEKLALFDRFHADRSQTRGWDLPPACDSQEYVRLFVSNPFPVQEWCYRLDGVLVGVGYVDDLTGGLSAIYFAHDPNHRDRSLGTWNVLNLIDRAAALGLPHVYLGYASEGCPSLRYKARFRPNQSLGPDGAWRDGRPSA